MNQHRTFHVICRATAVSSPVDHSAGALRAGWSPPPRGLSSRIRPPSSSTPSLTPIRPCAGKVGAAGTVVADRDTENRFGYLYLDSDGRGSARLAALMGASATT